MRSFVRLFIVLGFFICSLAHAEGIGYDMTNETQDGPSKTYTIAFDIWSTDKAADQLSVTPQSEFKNLEIKTKKKIWKKVPKGHHEKASVSVRNASAETGTLLLVLERKIGDRTDTKTITVQVAPQ